jgi:hypothetical protein
MYLLAPRILIGSVVVFAATCVAACSQGGGERAWSSDQAGLGTPVLALRSGIYIGAYDEFSLSFSDVVTTGTNADGSTTGSLSLELGIPYRQGVDTTILDGTPGTSLQGEYNFACSDDSCTLDFDGASEDIPFERFLPGTITLVSTGADAYETTGLLTFTYADGTAPFPSPFNMVYAHPYRAPSCAGPDAGGSPGGGTVPWWPTPPPPPGPDLSDVVANANAACEGQGRAVFGALGFSCVSSPLVLNGPARFLSQPVAFDFYGDGTEPLANWVGPQYPFLSLDLNGDGIINNGHELFGTQTVLPSGRLALNGFQALAQYDLDHNGSIDPDDPIYPALLLWLDANSDGICQASEVSTLASNDVASIDVQGETQAPPPGAVSYIGSSAGATVVTFLCGAYPIEVDDTWFALSAPHSDCYAPTAWSPANPGPPHAPGCFVWLSSECACPGVTDTSSEVQDPSAAANSSAAVCEAQAKAWYDTCGYAGWQNVNCGTVTATYYDATGADLGCQSAGTLQAAD